MDGYDLRLNLVLYYVLAEHYDRGRAPRSSGCAPGPLRGPPFGLYVLNTRTRRTRGVVYGLIRRNSGGEIQPFECRVVFVINLKLFVLYYVFEFNLSEMDSFLYMKGNIVNEFIIKLSIESRIHIQKNYMLYISSSKNKI